MGRSGDLRARAGPNPGAVAVIFMVLFLAGLVPVTLLAGDTPYPSPFLPPAEVLRFFGAHAGAVTICAFFHFGAAIPLGIYTATMTSRLRSVGVRVPGVDIALFGGFSASFMTSISALALWVLARPGVATDGTVVQALHSLAFAAGGPGYTAPLGLLIAGISVPAFIMRLLPRWLSVGGLVLAAIGELSALTLIAPAALFLVPLTRFPGFLWLIVAGFMLSRSGIRGRQP